MPCALLTDEPLTLRNLPRLADVDSFGHLLNELGVSTTIEGSRKGDFGRVMTLRAANITSTVAPYDIVRKMRASILVLGPLLARAGEATVSLPGGCAIGTRPIDLHLKALRGAGRGDRDRRRLCQGDRAQGRPAPAARSASPSSRSARPRMR